MNRQEREAYLRERARLVRQAYYSPEGLAARQRSSVAPGRQPSEEETPRALTAKLEKEAEPCPQRNEAWLVVLARKGLSAAKVITSADVPAEVCEGRLAKCRACPYSSKWQGKHYCGCCGCGHWKAGGVSSDLEYKCGKAAWECPGPDRAFGAYDPPYSSGV